MVVNLMGKQSESIGSSRIEYHTATSSRSHNHKLHIKIRSLLHTFDLLPYSRLCSCEFNFRTAGAGRKLDFEKLFLPI